MRVLVTGGAGNIGSHTVLGLLRAGHEVLVFDNFSTGSQEALCRVKAVARTGFETVAGDVRCRADLDAAFSAFRPNAVIHIAGLKSVTDSIARPQLYHDHNVRGTKRLLAAMTRHGCRRIVFSSSATVYGHPRYLPIDETHPTGPLNPYGRSKLAAEQAIRAWAGMDGARSAILLRYFNPAGADASGLLGEEPRPTSGNLFPRISQVANGRLPAVQIFGNDFDTRDGTGERDFLHVEDLARAHLAALDHVDGHRGCETVNVGTGKGVTVLEILRAFERAAGVAIPYEISTRRPGDAGRSVAAIDKAARLLGWRARHGLDAICRSAWHWQMTNPDGYGPGPGDMATAPRGPAFCSSDGSDDPLR